MEKHTEVHALEGCECEVEETGVVKVNGLIISYAQLPDFLANQVESISSSSKAISDMIDKADELNDRAINLKNKAVRVLNKKENIVEIQEVVSEMFEILSRNCDAMKCFQDNFDKLSKTSEVLLGLSLVNSAQRNMVIRTIQQKLENASKEKLTELAKQELKRVLHQLNAQQELDKRVATLQEKVAGYNELMRDLKADVKKQLDEQKEVVDGSLKESKAKADVAIKQATENFKKQLDEQKETVDRRLKEGKEKTDGAINQATENFKKQLDEQNSSVENRLKENEDDFTGYRKDLDELLSQCVNLEKHLNEHKTVLTDQKQEFVSYSETTTKALNEVAEKCDKLIKKKRGNGWRCFLSALLGCGVAFLAFYLFYHFM